MEKLTSKSIKLTKQTLSYFKFKRELISEIKIRLIYSFTVFKCLLDLRPLIFPKAMNSINKIMNKIVTPKELSSAF